MTYRGLEGYASRYFSRCQVNTALQFLSLRITYTNSSTYKQINNKQQ